jgi:micrococcal nuclease
MRWRFLALVVLVAACSGGDGDGLGGSAITVDRVVDGDTFDVHDAVGTERVRILGVNAPEAGECFHDDATAALVRLLDGGEVTLVRDTSDRDPNGRLLRYVEVDGADAGLALVRGGFAIARVSAPDEARRPAIEAAEAEARAAMVGLWAPDACGPASPADVEIVGVRADADGPDDRNLDDEWVELANAGPAAVDLTGWTVRDESSSHRFAFPPGFTLAPGAHVRIRSGCGATTPTDLHWCESGSAVWNNDGDTAFLLDPSGNVVTTFSY